MKYVYSVTIQTASGQLARYNIVATSRDSAEAAARKRAGVDVGVEPENVSRMFPVDIEAN